MREYIAEDIYDPCGSIIGISDHGELIRCKDCIKKELCSIYRDAKQEYGFCAWAVRKDNDTVD